MGICFNMKKYLGWLSVLVVIFFALPFLPINGTVRAQSFITPVIPSFGLITDENAIITSENVTIDIEGFEPNFNNNYATVESVYVVNKMQGTSAELYVPYLGKMTDTVNIDVSVNDEPSACEVRYGDNYFVINKTPNPNEILSGIILPDLSGVPDGTLYKFTPNGNTLTVNMLLAANQPLIYDCTNSLTSSTGQDYFNLALKNITAGQDYYFFLANGDFSEPPVSNAEYTKQTISCKDYIDGFFDYYRELFDKFYPTVPREFYYSEMQRALSGYLRCSTDDFFFSRLDTLRGNTLCFQLFDTLPDVITVKIKQRARVQINNQFDPFIFLTQYVPYGNHVVEYTLCLNETYPYVIESNVTLNKQQEKIYKCSNQTSSEAPYFIFSSSEHHTDRYAQADQQQNRNRLIVLAVCIPVCVIALGVLIFNAIQIVRKRRRS